MGCIYLQVLELDHLYLLDSNGLMGKECTPKVNEDQFLNQSKFLLGMDIIFFLNRLGSSSQTRKCLLD